MRVEFLEKNYCSVRVVSRTVNGKCKMMIILIIIMMIEVKSTDTPWPLPPDCKVTDPQSAYSRNEHFLTFASENRNESLNLKFSNDTGIISGSYPDPISFDGLLSRKLSHVNGFVQLHSLTGEGKIDISFDGHSLSIGSQPSEKNVSGNFRVISTDFNGWNNQYVPFMRSTNGISREHGGAISSNFIQHGCSQQGEPGLPFLKSRMSTWGHADVYLNGTIFYKNVWLHSMYTNAYRDSETHAIYSHDKKSFYKPTHCDDAFTSPFGKKMQFSLVVARNCLDSNPAKVHKTTDMDMLLVFDVV